MLYFYCPSFTAYVFFNLYNWPWESLVLLDAEKSIELFLLKLNKTNTNASHFCQQKSWQRWIKFFVVVVGKCKYCADFVFMMLNFVYCIPSRPLVIIHFFRIFIWLHFYVCVFLFFQDGFEWLRKSAETMCTSGRVNDFFNIDDISIPVLWRTKPTVHRLFDIFSHQKLRR